MRALLQKVYFSVFDRSLFRPQNLPDRDDLEHGEWNRMIGEKGENLAGKYLRFRGKKVLYRNFRGPDGGEVDIVFRDADTLVFAEVKTRSGDQFGRPGKAVDREKQMLIIRGANAWLRELHLPDVLFRFDVIEVILKNGEIPDIRWNQEVFATPQAGLGM